MVTITLKNIVKLMINLKKQTLLVIAPHPDDEVLGCGGLIKKIKDEGGKVFVLFMTNGTTQDYSKTGISTSQERLDEIERVSKYLGYDDYDIAFTGDKYHLKLDQIPQLEIISAIENSKKISLNKIQPTIVACPQPDDYNQDHRACAQALIAASRPAPNIFKPLTPTVISYEFTATSLWSIDNPKKPNIFVELTDKQLKAKVEAMKLYSSQVREGFSTRSLSSIKNLALSRGSQTGVKAAEAFFSFRVLV